MPAGTATAEIVWSFTEFGPFLRYLRRRVRLTQRDLGIAVGYSTPQISLLEGGQRLPDLTTLAALFVPALDLQNEVDLAARLLQLAAAAHSQNAGLTITRTVRRQITLTEIIETTISLTPTQTSESSHSQASIPKGHDVSYPPPFPPNLPAPVWPLLGRDREVEAARTLLLNPALRLLSLIGPPGVGKTRLALQLAWETYAHFTHGVHFIELAAVQEPALLIPTLMQALAITERTDAEAPPAPLKPLRDYLRDKRLLLILDNFEHLMPAASMVAELLAAAPYLKIVITSRAALHLYGEQEFPVPPLALPNLAQLPPLEELSLLPAVALFMARAQAVRPEVMLTAENALAIAALCVRLDGLPLAIELAAAHCRYFTPQQLTMRLIGQNPAWLKFLEHGWRNLPPRHQTLLGAIDWSYRLLGPDEQILFARLGVFVGGFDADAGEAVYTNLHLAAGAEQIANGQTAGGVLDKTGNILAEIISLVDKNLVCRVEMAGGEARFNMLETLREYALEQLRQRGELEAVRRRQAEFFLALAETAEAKLRTPEQEEWFARLERERGNFNSVLAWALDECDPSEVVPAGQMLPQELGMRLCVALWRFWRYRCYLAEGHYWTERALLADRNSPSPAPRRLRAQALWGLGLISALMHQESEAVMQLEESLNLAQAEEDAPWIAAALTGLGMLANERGERDRAIAFQEQALALYEAENDLFGMTYAHNALGETFCGGGDYTASREHYRASLKLSDRLGHQRGVAVARANIAQIETSLGNYLAAGQGFKASLQLFQEIGDPVNAATCLMGLACVATMADSAAAWHEAAQLFGCGEHLLQETKGKLQPGDQLIIDRHLALCRQKLGDAAFEAARTAGQALSLQQASARSLALG